MDRMNSKNSPHDREKHKRDLRVECENVYSIWRMANRLFNPRMIKCGTGNQAKSKSMQIKQNQWK